MNRDETGLSVRPPPLFVVALVLTLVAAAFNAVMVGLMALRLDSLLPGPFADMAHFTEPRHRTHDLTFGFLFIPTVVGVLAQFRRPSRNVAGMVMALVPSAALVLTLTLTLVTTGDGSVLQPPWITVMAGALVAAGLHPAGRDFFASFDRRRASRAMLLLVLVAALPLLAFASDNIRLQGTIPDDHALMGHYGFMAALGLAALGLGVLAALRPDGWRLTAWVAGLLPVLLGAASLIYPDASSSLNPAWALAAITWGTAFVAAAERSRGLPGPVARHL